MALADESVRVTNGVLTATLPASAPWTTIGANNQAMRWELRVHGWGTGQFQTSPIITLPGGISLAPYGSSSLQAGTSTAEDALFNNGPSVINCCSGHGDILIRVQRDVANNRYTLEVEDTAANFYASSTVAIVATTLSWEGSQFRIIPGIDVAWVEWYSSVVPLGTGIPVTPTASGDLGSWNFEGDTNDRSGQGNNLNGGTVQYVISPIYLPLCNVGSQQTFRGGHPGTLDGSGSRALDGGTTLQYFWTQLSGPSTLEWSDRSLSSPVISGTVFGTYVLQLTVTDGSGQSSSCTVKDGAVASDDNGVVITNQTAVDTLLGPLIRWGANPWPYYDDRHKAMADYIISELDTYWFAYWDQFETGTVDVSTGSNIVTGHGTAFQSRFCGGRTTGNSYIIVAYPTGRGTETGRRYEQVVSCASDTQLTIAENWSVVPSGNGLNYAWNNYATYAWDSQNWPANFYDNVAALYSLYYRSGIDDYLNAARKLADRYWTSPSMDRGVSYNLGQFHGNLIIYDATLGLVLRALDSPAADMWGSVGGLVGLHNIWDCTHYELGTYFPSEGLPGLNPGGRESGYFLSQLAKCAMFDTSSTYQVQCKADIVASISKLWAGKQQPSGDIPTLIVGTAGHSPAGGYNASWYAPTTSATVTYGSSTVVGNGNPWTSAMFSDCTPTLVGCPIVFSNSITSYPAISGDLESRVYYATFVDANHLILHDSNGNVEAYQNSGCPAPNGCTKGWMSGDSSGVEMVGYGSQPYATGGLLPWGFNLAAQAVATYDPAASDTLHGYAANLANWVKNDAYISAENGMAYWIGSSRCIAPLTGLTPGCTTDTTSARQLALEPIRGLTSVYQNHPDSSTKSFIDLLYSGEWNRSDPNHLSGYDDGGYYMSGTPPANQSSKAFGQAFGVSSLSNWPAIRLGGVAQPNNIGVSISFNLASVPNSTATAVTITAPDGVTNATLCTVSPCSATIDARQGAHLIEIDYVSGGGAVLARGDVMPLYVQ